MIEVSSWNMKFVAECLKFLGPFGGGSWQPAAEGEDEEMAQLLGQMGGGAGSLPPGVVQVGAVEFVFSSLFRVCSVFCSVSCGTLRFFLEICWVEAFGVSASVERL
jgi:hypothetical protein